jgi:hypothetical protein
MEKRQRGELLIWPGVGPIGPDPVEIAQFENFVSSKFGARIEFEGDIERKDGECDTAIRFFNDCGDGSEIMFRLFCVSNGIYPAVQINHFEYDMDSLMKFLK